MKKAIKIIASIIIIVLVLLFGVEWWLEGKIKKTASEQIYEKTGGRIIADVGRVNISLIGRKVNIEEVTFRTDTTRPVMPGIPFEYADGRIRRITVKGIHYHKKDSAISVSARQFELDIPQATLISAKDAEDKRPEKTDTLGQQMKLAIGNFDLHLGDIFWKQHQHQDTVNYFVQELKWHMDDWKIDTAPDSIHPPCLCEDIRISLNGFQNQFARNSQLLEIDSLSINGKERMISVGRIALIPRYPMEEFALKSPGHTDWTKITAGKITLYGWDMQRLLKEQFLQIDSVDLQQADIASFKNRKIEQLKKVKRLFYQSVQQLPLHFAVRRVNLNHIDVKYLELSENGERPGTITFNRLNGMFYDLTNVSRPHQAYYTLKAEGKLMDRGVMQATFRLPVAPRNDLFEVEGHLGAMSITDLNPMIEPLVKIRVVSGELDDLKFRIKGDSIQSKVDMVFLYRDLKVRLLKEKDGEIKVRSFLTTLANGLIFTENNPNHRGERQVEATAERDVYRSQFNYLWRSLLAGLKKSIGL